jgi:hypothetical protein
VGRNGINVPTAHQPAAARGELGHRQTRYRALGATAALTQCSACAVCNVVRRGSAAPDILGDAANSSRVKQGATTAARSHGRSAGPPTRAGPRDLLREFDHEPVGVGDMYRAVSPWPVRRSSQQYDAALPQPGRDRIDIPDQQHDLRARARDHRMSDQPLRPALLIEREAGRPGGELRVTGVGEPMLQPGHITIERDRRGQVGDVHNHMTQLRHEQTLTPPPARPGTLSGHSSASAITG